MIPTKNPSGVLEALNFSNKGGVNAGDHIPQVSGKQVLNLTSDREFKQQQSKNYYNDEYGISHTKVLSPAQVVFVQGENLNSGFGQ